MSPKIYESPAERISCDIVNIAGVIRALWKEKKIGDQDRAAILAYLRKIENNLKKIKDGGIS